VPAKVSKEEGGEYLRLPVTMSAFSSGVNCATKALAFSKAASHPPEPVMFAVCTFEQNLGSYGNSMLTRRVDGRACVILVMFDSELSD